MMNLQRRHDTDNSWDWRAALSAGRLAAASGSPERALDRFREALDLAETSRDLVGVGEALNTLGVALSSLGQTEEAAKVFRRIIETQPTSEAATLARISLGEVLTRLGQPREAETVLREAETRVDSDSQPLEWATLMNNLGILLAEQGKAAEASCAFVAALDRARAAMGPDHPRTIMLLGNFGAALRRAGDEAGGLSAVREALAAADRVLGADSSEARLLRAEIATA